MTEGKIYAISDLHVDQNVNMQWVEQLANEKYLNDTVIIAGDVTHILSKLEYTLRLFKSKFKDVYYCPGNHELWVQSSEPAGDKRISNSIEKFHYIMKLCEDIGIHTKPGVTDQGVIIMPLFGWYDDSLHFPADDTISDLKIWTDHHRCEWTDEVPQSQAAKYFVELNEEHISNLNRNRSNSKIITFSHFLTSRKLMVAYGAELRRRRLKRLENEKDQPNKQETTIKPLVANFTLVAGTELLDKQLKLIKPQVHIFGHSHRKMFLETDDGIRYINNPLGYKRERDTGAIQGPPELYEVLL